MKGVILAGGFGTRLRPMTSAVPKNLLPVFDKPLIYYPLSFLMEAEIREILVVTRAEEQGLFQKLLRDGRGLGVRVEYAVQEAPRGIADAFLAGKSFFCGEPVCLILGDNIFYAPQKKGVLEKIRDHQTGARIFAYRTQTPERFGIVELDQRGGALSLEEKPKNPKSDWAVTGLYVYDSQAVDFANTLAPSARGELEITDLNRCYLEQGTLHVERLKDWVWFDAGTPENLFEAAGFVQKQKTVMGDPREVARRLGWVARESSE